MGFLASLGMMIYLVYQGGGKERRAEEYLLNYPFFLKDFNMELPVGMLIYWTHNAR
jgi:hypothetical protein